MKRITLIIIGLFTFSLAFSQTDIRNFKVTADIDELFSWNNGDIFNYEFEIKGDYDYNEIKLYVYYNSISSDNLIGLSRWNYEGDYNLNFSTYTLQSKWNTPAYVWSGRSFTTSIGTTFYLVAEYQGVQTIYSYTITSEDRDGDGILNDQDNCPDEAGPSSNNGCPILSPNLSVDSVNSIVFSSCMSCNPYLNTFLNSSKRHLVAGGVGSITFNKLNIRNTGNTTSNSGKIDFYYSTNTTLVKSGGNADKKLESKTIPALEINKSHGIELSISGVDIFGVDHNSPSTNGNFYILVDIDATDTNSEGETGEGDNLLIIPATYNYSSTATSKILSNKIPPLTEEKSLFEVYNLSGENIISTKTDYSEQEEIIDQLPKGIYIIKTNTNTKKIIK
ncbi:T9SS type A sorting domain-containing protein [Formosa algae]|uniref:Secretion system C-terminal sorting domain-containing protein n=1 Tax=Formosa algae TaxID=225843 RepID=A0A9X1C8F8_9FLAO|nr:T9SS type A sorting domain-containing protein [Formosa algae]MBP1838443.1 hypothetical protein [Formosa algae]MDQ0334578.1 hypothetical protein [Formosa algae]OEI79321.1 hypothetical protein AST99_15025 [Formosa algae]